MEDNNIINFDEKAAEKLKSMQEKPKKPKPGTLAALPFSRSKDKEAKIKTNSLMNIELILDNDPELKDMFKFNEFTAEIEVVKDSASLHIVKGQLLDRYVDEIASYIERAVDYDHVLFNSDRIRSAINVVASRHAYNPVKDYFDSAEKEWDGDDRLHNVFSDYLGVEKTPATDLIADIWFRGAVAKAYNPMVKFDFVLDLVGGQGAGKTTFLQKIAPLGYYTDQFLSFTDKDDFAVMRRSLIVNDDELTATSNSSFEELKKFVTLQMFEYRKPYGHTAERFPKNFVMARTTNELYYLKDKTGERRFLPIHVSKAAQKFHPVTDLTPEYVKQLWGQVVSDYRKNRSFYLLEEAEAVLNEQRENFMYTDEVEDQIEMLLESTFKDRHFISASEIALQMGISDLTTNRKLANQIANVMINRFGWRKGRGYLPNGKRMRGYVK
ncbi:virulence-associated E family protein [Limosilactobacillus mucosae]|uniref:Virulence-associated E family protein n=1 Tax=Limosilactobacillus mucosae TaxID=97478 RepID=A0AAJ1HWU1_LIMMU|nr:virulence-associated E family protein [Limosilactobacillus mucosae]MDC2830040.1 virulence-associated E family protein [Limosilactobacillus mucosae]MDC2837497.1 virulence-associated E family protein [Limosilactobacillus mucosae]MDC2853764.1 virulence-associated E family protein [Limosilactobacillus mucosae]